MYAERLDLEGLVAKRKADPYGTDTVWYEIKSRTCIRGEGRGSCSGSAAGTTLVRCSTHMRWEVSGRVKPGQCRHVGNLEARAAFTVQRLQLAPAGTPWYRRRASLPGSTPSNSPR